MRTWANRRLREFDRDREHGFVAVFLALILTILLVFAAFTVDFGSWYTRSAELKRAADVAALAGVVWMPEFDLAQQYALATAAKNGFVNGQNNITVSVDTVPNNNRQLRVTIRDAKAKQFFSKLVTNSQSIGRSSLAEYVLPVPLGSPENVFGTGNLALAGQPATQNFWAAINGYCAGHESGDPKSAYYESYNSGTSTTCNNGSALNTDDYDPNGYLYAIDLPANSSSLKLDVYDGDFNRTGSSMDISVGGSGSESVTTNYTIYNKNPTPLDTSQTNLDSLKLTTVGVNTNDTTYQNTWKNLYTWSSPQAGRYYVRVQTPVQPNNSRGSNGFSLRAWTGSSYTTCSTITGSSNYSANCPQVHAVSDMSIYANLGGAVGTYANFYLAQIDPVHAGKTMRVNLFDAGKARSSCRSSIRTATPRPSTGRRPAARKRPRTADARGRARH